MSTRQDADHTVTISHLLENYHTVLFACYTIPYINIARRPWLHIIWHRFDSSHPKDVKCPTPSTITQVMQLAHTSEVEAKVVCDPPGQKP